MFACIQYFHQQIASVFAIEVQKLFRFLQIAWRGLSIWRFAEAYMSPLLSRILQYQNKSLDFLCSFK